MPDINWGDDTGMADSPFNWGEDDTAAPPKFTVEHDDPFASTEVIEGELVTEDDFKDYMVLTALQTAVNDAIADFTKKRRVETLRRLNAEAQRTDASQITIRAELNDGQKITIAKVSLTGGDAEIIVESQGDVLDWAQEHRPELVAVIEHPEVIIPERKIEAHTTRELVRNGLTKLVEGLEVKDGKYHRLDPATGELVVVPGLTYKPAGEATGFKYSWGGTGSPLKKQALGLLMEGRIVNQTIQNVVRRAEIQQKQENQK